MPAKTLMTAAEFANSGPETDGFELVRGELVPMPPPKELHGQVCGNVATVLGIYRRSRGGGRLITNDTGLMTSTSPDTVRGPDLLFVLNPTATGLAPNQYITTPPDLAVEVRSEGQAWNDLLNKVDEYLHMGVRMVWIVDPSVQRLTVFEAEQAPAMYAAENEFDGGDVLPGLHFKVAELFE